MAAAIFLAIATAASIALGFVRHKALQAYWSRTCQGLSWRRAFPNASKAEIRSFLTAFLDAFAFSQKHLLKFTPSDRITSIYSASNPFAGVDSLELERLAIAMRRNYNFNLQPFWRPTLTLGELFTMIGERPN
jgi:propanediol dehydratase small subunit